MRTSCRGELGRGHLRIRTRSLPPIALHWSAFFGALFLGAGRVGGVVAFILLVLVHELGHAFLVRVRGLRALEIRIHAFGGACHYEPGWGTPLDHAIIAWGGVAAQLALFAFSMVFARVVVPAPGFVSDVLFVFIVPNLLLIVLNLLPIQGLDGNLAWQLPSMLHARGSRRRLEGKHERLRRELEAIERRRKMH